MDLRIVWLALGSFAVGVDGFIIGSLLPAIARETGVDIPTAGYVAFAFSLTTAIGVPVMLAAIGAADRRRVLAGGVLVFAIGALTMALAPGLWLIILGRVVIAIGAGLFISMGQATAMTLAPPEQRARALTTMMIGTSAAMTLGVPVGAMIAGAWGWRTSYLVIAGLGVLAAALLWTLLPRGMVGVARSLRERVGVVALPGVPMLLIINAIFMFGGFLPLIYIAPIATDAMHLAPDALPAVLVALGLGALAANLVSGRLIDRLGPRRTALLAAVGGVAVLVLLWAVSQVSEGLGGAALPVFWLLMFFNQVAGWTLHAAQIARIATLVGDQSPLGIAINGTAINLGSGAAAIVGGLLLRSYGATSLLWSAALICVVPVALLSLVRPAPIAKPA